MIAADLERLLELFSVFRGANVDRHEAAQFRRDFAAASAELVDRAIRSSAAELGYVTLASTTHQYSRILGELAAEMSRQEIAARQAANIGAGGSTPANPSWPSKPGEPTTTYLAAISFFAANSRACGSRAAERYIRGRLVLREHAERILAAMWPAGRELRGKERARLGGEVLEQIERELGMWGRCPAESYVGRDREPGEDDA